MFKKSIVYLLVLFMVLGFALTGCSSKEPPKEPEQGETEGFLPLVLVTSLLKTPEGFNGRRI